MHTQRRSLIISLAGTGLTLLLMALIPFFISPSRAQESTAPAPEATESASLFDLSVSPKEVTGDNSYCAMCHTVAWRNVTLADGFVLNLFVPPEAVANSVHGGETPVGCVDCHGQDAFPHNEPRPTSHRAYSLEANQMCVACHAEHATEAAQGLHAQAILAGNTSAAVCTDCHNAHDVQKVARQPQLVAGVCADCHQTTFDEWRTSPHNAIGPLGCATCHSAHSQEIRIESGDPNDLCLNCHKQMPDLWVHASHANNQSAQCTDCHMYTGAEGVTANAPAQTAEGAGALFVNNSANASVIMPTGHSMSVTTAPCTTCHAEQAVGSPSAEATPEAEAAPSTEAGDSHSTSLAPAPSTSDGGFVPLLQGLILGLGLGATAATVFVVRGNRRH